MLKYPMSAVGLCFFTRRSGRAETCGCLLSSPGEQVRGLDICIPTRNPFVKLWVKAQTNAHPRIHILFFAALFRCRQFNYMRLKVESQVLTSKFQAKSLLPNSTR